MAHIKLRLCVGFFCPGEDARAQSPHMLADAVSAHGNKRDQLLAAYPFLSQALDALEAIGAASIEVPPASLQGDMLNEPCIVKIAYLPDDHQFRCTISMEGLGPIVEFVFGAINPRECSNIGALLDYLIANAWLQSRLRFHHREVARYERASRELEDPRVPHRQLAHT